MDVAEVHLVHFHAHFHLRRVHNLQKRHARPHLIAFLHRSHSPAEPNRVVNNHSLHRRMHHHFRCVPLRVIHSRFCAVPLNLHDAHRRRARPPLQRIRLFQLLQRRVRFIHRFQVFLRIDTRNDFVLLHFQLRALQFVFGLLQCRVIFRSRDVLVGLFLRHLAHQIFVRALLVQVIFRLCLRIEFHQHVIFLHLHADRRKLRNHHRSNLRAFESRRQHHKRPRRLRRPVQTQ